MKVESVNPGVERFKQGGEKEEGYERVRWGGITRQREYWKKAYEELLSSIPVKKYIVIFF